MKALNLQPKMWERFRQAKTFFVIEEESDLPTAGLVSLGKPGLKIVTMTQTHGRQVTDLEIADNSSLVVAGDGCFTRKAGLGLTVRTADCLPILFYNERARLIGAIHAGWRGTLAGISASALGRILKKYHTRLEDFSFYFGPAAQKCCYEVGADLAARYKKKFGRAVVRRDENRDYLDFVAANKLQLSGLGIFPDRIEDSGICTIHNINYPSWRRQKTRRPVLLSVIYLE